MATVADFLKSIGMAEYAAGLSDSGADVSDLRSLTERDLEKLGVPPADRDRLLRALAGFHSDSEPAAPADRPPGRSIERRHLTILFCDLVGSTEISSRVDLEELHEKIMDPYKQRCGDVIEKWGGFVGKYLGDGVLAYFGYPRASEDAAERAVHAGLDLIKDISELRDDMHKALRARVGIASGLVVVGDLTGAGDAHEHDVVGGTPNLAARLQASAEPNSVIISGETRRLVGDLFECIPVDIRPLKGIAAPAQAWRIVGPTGIADRFRALRTSTRPLVGREREIDLLMRGWESAKAGNGCAVLISGEPGIGKSRLVEALLSRLEDQPHVRVRIFCAPNRQDSTLYPAIAQLEKAAEISRDDTTGQKLDKLEAVLGQATTDLAEAAPLIAELLSIPTEGRYPTLELTPQKRREKTLRALLAQLEGLARRPTIMVFEDVHWIDATTLELLSLTVDRAPQLPLLLLVTFRPEFAPPWLGRPHVTRIDLDRLPKERSAELIADITRQNALPSATVDQIIERTDGIPLFIEELTKALVERGGASPSAREIPATLSDMLTARLDRMGEAKEVAQIASVIGNEFSALLLKDVAPIAEEQLNAELKRLVAAGLLFEPAKSYSTTYRFKHALTQEAAYQSLVRTRRQHYHRKIAETLRERFPDIAEAHPEILAHHYAGAVMPEVAIPYLKAAAEKSMRRSANPEAIAHLTKAQELLDALPEGPERLQQELVLKLAIGTPLIATKGFASPEVGKVYARAREICELAGGTPQLFPVLWGLWVFYTARAEHRTAQELAEQCVAIGNAANDRDLLMLAHHAMGVTLTTIGRHADAMPELEQVIAIHDPVRHASLAFAYGQDSGVVCRSQMAFSLWFLGFPEKAKRLNEEAVALAERLNHPYSLAAALDFSAWVDQLRGDSVAAREHAEKAIAISSTHDFVFWLLTGMILRGWALAAEHRVEEGVAQMRQAFAGYEQTGAGILRPYYLALIADVYGRMGKEAEALQLLDEAVDAVQTSEERWWEAELHRLKGELTLKQIASQGSDAERIAEAYFDKAGRVAAEQGARSLELRAATSLGRLWMKQGKKIEARSLLGETYSRFSEGFDLPDLREAKLVFGS